MSTNGIPNTRIPVGKLNENHLEKISKAYIDCKLEISGKTMTVSIDSINEANLERREFEITPQPFGRIDSKVILHPKYSTDGNMYINIKIHPEDYAINNIVNYKKIQENFNQKIKEYFIDIK